MTTLNLVDKIQKRWWMFIILPLIFFAVFFPKLNQNSYTASIGLGTNFNNPEFVGNSSTQGNNESEYVLSLKEFSAYLAGRLASVEVQAKIIEKLKLDIPINQKVAFYNITTQSGGYVSVSWNANSQDEAKNFLVAIKEVYSEILSIELNKGVLAKYQVSIKKDFVESVIPVSNPPQLNLLPIIAGLLVALVIAIFLPKNFLKLKT